MNMVFLLLILSIVACEKSPQQARRDLVKLDYSYSRNSMVEAIRKGDAESTRLFLVAGMEPGAVSAGYSVLEHAAASADQAIVAILLEAGADPGASGGVSTPLIEASSRGNTGIAQQLLAAGADGGCRCPLWAL